MAHKERGFYAFPPLYTGTLIKRYKRFFADIDTSEGVITAHNPNTGAMLSLLEEGAPVLYSKAAAGKARKLPYTLEAIKAKGEWVISNTHRANDITEAFLPHLKGLYLGGSVAREYAYKDSRIDFLVDGKTLIEVKSVTHFDDRRALFPDAVTKRGRKHILTLMTAVEEGYRAAMLYLCFVERAYFETAKEIDPEYDKALRQAAKSGVEVWRVTAVYNEGKNGAELKGWGALRSLAR